MHLPKSTSAPSGNIQGTDPEIPKAKTEGKLDLASGLSSKLAGVINEGQLAQIIAQLTNQIDSGPTPASQAQEVEGPKQPRIDPELIARLAVAQRADGNKEIRIQLRSDALPNTEIIINRDANGLNISFATTSEQANQLLNQNLSQIQTALKNRLSGENVHVKIDYKESASAQNEDEDPDYFIRRT